MKKIKNKVKFELYKKIWRWAAKHGYADRLTWRKILENNNYFMY